jgi:glutathione S-transferase
MPEEGKKIYRDRIISRLEFVDKELAGKQYLTGDNFSVADGYLFTVTRWTKPMNIDISGFKNLSAFMERVAQRPAVQEALKVEGLQ